MSAINTNRISGITLIAGIVISIVLLGLFFLGGQMPESQKIAAELTEPRFTDLLLYWCYILLLITVVVLVVFAIVEFVKQLRESPKKALGGFMAIFALVGMLVVTYVFGDGTALSIPGYEGSDNVPTILKMSDMWLYSCYFMLVITVLAIFVMPLLKRKK